MKHQEVTISTTEMTSQIRDFGDSTEYKRDLGLIEAISIVISRIIGSGIFRTPAPIMALVGCTSLFGLVWVLGGIVTIFGAVVYAELAAMMPRSGGPYVYLKMAYHPFWAFLRGWAMFFVSETAAIAAVALIFGEYLKALWIIAFGHAFGQITLYLIALTTIWLLTIVNLFGVSLSGKIQNFFGAIKVVAVGGIIGASFTSWSTGSFSNFMNPLMPEAFNGSTFLAVGAALRYAFFAFSGWEGATYIAEEVKNPRRNLPLSLFIGIAGVMVLYMGANSAYLYQLTPAQIADSKWVATEAMKVALGATGGILISVAVMFNTFGNVSTQILCKARAWQAMARDGMFFKKFAVLSKKHKTPNNALIGQGLWATVLLTFAVTAANSYESIIDFFSATSTVFNLMVFAAIFVLRKKYPDVSRPYKAWLYPWSLIIVFVIYATFFVITLMTTLIPSLIGLGLTSLGSIYYYFYIYKSGIRVK
ncbi:MAG: amino acid permease [Candidatus Marinimicrobia bacterium]|nr:amino acid permease [Candidatus Neomarinimicrobiota bacterium]MBT4359753.1 amino acid permease [Candidatus Neomarinimicrobiota bacterium]MBT4945182.1 amino acid permease [Candidatus Neomarinimicrobiota bacterium]MBT5269928.1 amino acid permease [Candidatus Neomarinimicrobiota bacterium]MBT6010177.1 amino acid permease [Candidatus Neomarinimicrobiota bacterium]